MGIQYNHFLCSAWAKTNILFFMKKNTVRHKFFHAGKLEFLQFPGTLEEEQFCFSWAEANAFASV